MCKFSEVRNAEKAIIFIKEHYASNSISFDGYVPCSNGKAAHFAPMYNEKTVKTVNTFGMPKTEDTFVKCLSHIEDFHYSKGNVYVIGTTPSERTECFEMIAYPKYKLDKWFIKIYNARNTDGSEFPVVVFHRANQYSYTI